MTRFLRLTPIHLRASCLLFLGVLGMALHVLAAAGLVPMRSMAAKDGQFVAELCSSHGVVKAGALPVSGGESHPASGAHDCCKFCAAAAPLLAASSKPGVLFPPVFAAPRESRGHVRLSGAVWAAHPARGPPAQA